jgi:hypothetical protein
VRPNHAMQPTTLVVTPLAWATGAPTARRC